VTSYAYDAMSRRTQVVNNAIQTAPLLQLAYSPDRLLACAFSKLRPSEESW
jgi:hypothetical protein